MYYNGECGRKYFVFLLVDNFFKVYFFSNFTIIGEDGSKGRLVGKNVVEIFLGFFVRVNLFMRVVKCFDLNNFRNTGLVNYLVFFEVKFYFL